MKPTVCKFKFISGIMHTMTRCLSNGEKGWCSAQWASRNKNLKIIEYLVPEDYKHEKTR